MRWPRAMVLMAILALLAACGGNGPGDDDPDDGDTASQAAAQSEPTEASAAPPPDDGGGDDGGGDDGDAGEAFERLTPPNAAEVTKTTSAGVIYAAFTTPDSVESLTSFYEDAFNDLGLQILTTTETAGGVSWFVGTDENASEFGGVVAAIPNTDGGPGSTVTVQIGATN